jgi:hypothetical protein
MLGYGLLASAIAYTGTLGLSQTSHAPTAKNRPATRHA